MDLKELNKIFNDFGKYMVKQSRANLTRADKGDGKLYKSISYKIDDSKKDTVEWSFYMENYGVFQDQGVRGARPSDVKMVDKKHQTAHLVIDQKCHQWSR